MLNQKNTLGKTYVRSYEYSDIFTDRNDAEAIVISGRDFIKYGTRTAITASGYLYKKATDVEPLNYFLLIGIARQSESGYGINRDAASELAAVNAQMNPVITIELDDIPTQQVFEQICKSYSLNFLKKKFLKTPEEINLERYGE